MTGSGLRIVSLLPDLLGTYGDNGNVDVLAHRMRSRGHPVEVWEVRHGDTVPLEGDLYILGGGEDDAQAAAVEALRGPVLPRIIERGTPVFAVCAGLQLLGHSFAAESGGTRRGLELLDLTTTRLAVRAVGETILTPDPCLHLPQITGFSNHGGCTVLGPAARPLGSVAFGPGNAGAGDRLEGVLQGPVLGTYLHGPVLARNPALADHLLSHATRQTLTPLPPGPPELLHAERIAAALARRRLPWVRPASTAERRARKRTRSQR